MRIVAGTYEGFCYGWEYPIDGDAPKNTTAAANKAGIDAKKDSKKDTTTAGPPQIGSQTQQAHQGQQAQALSLVFGYNVHVGCMKSVAMATSGTRAGQLLVTGGADERVRIYDLRDRTELGELQQHNGAK